MGHDAANFGVAFWLMCMALIVLVFDAVRSSHWASHTAADCKSLIKPTGIVALVFGALIGIGQMLKLDLAQYALYLFAGLAATFVTCAIDPLKHRHMRTMFLMACSAALVWLNPAGFFMCASAFAIGMVTLRLVLNLLEPERARLDDVAAPFAYLASMTLASCGVSGSHPVGKAADVVSAAFAVGCLLNMMQRPFMHADTLYVKRLVLVVAGGLGMLVAVTKGLNLVEYTKISVLLGAGFGAMYALDALNRCAFDEKAGGAHKAAKFVKQVLVVGIFTLIASRLFGNVGVGVLAAASLVGTTQASACFAAYLGARLMEQAFAYEGVANVTGINLQHPYVSAAQYLGVFIVLSLIVMIKESHDRRFDAIALALVGALGTALVSYFIHGEATGSYLVALASTGVVGTMLGQAFFAGQENRAFSVMLVPAIAGATACFTQALGESGLTAGMETRLQVIGGFAVVALILIVASTIINKKAPSQHLPAES